MPMGSANSLYQCSLEVRVMHDGHAASLFKAVRDDQASKYKQVAIKHAEAFVKIASRHGYRFTEDTLAESLTHLSDQEVAAMVNPGVGQRTRLIPR
jgi:hypothetical protein